MQPSPWQPRHLSSLCSFLNEMKWNSTPLSPFVNNMHSISNSFVGSVAGCLHAPHIHHQCNIATVITSAHFSCLLFLDYLQNNNCCAFRKIALKSYFLWQPPASFSLLSSGVVYWRFLLMLVYLPEGTIHNRSVGQLFSAPNVLPRLWVEISHL